MVNDAFPNSFFAFGRAIARSEAAIAPTGSTIGTSHPHYIVVCVSSCLSSCCGLASARANHPSRGTELIVRLNTPFEHTSKVDQAVEAVTITPVLDQNKMVIPTGVKVKGRIAETKPASSQMSAPRSPLIRDFGGAKTKAIVADVDNARESVDSTGQIIGIVASETLAARSESGYQEGRKAKNAGFAGILEAAKGAVFTAQPSGEIKYEPGVEIELSLSSL